MSQLIGWLCKCELKRELQFLPCDGFRVASQRNLFAATANVAVLPKTNIECGGR
jgi:hypothetical protein